MGWVGYGDRMGISWGIVRRRREDSDASVKVRGGPGVRWHRLRDVLGPADNKRSWKKAWTMAYTRSYVIEA